MGLDDDEDLVTYGTPLITDDNEDEVPRKKPIPIDQQVVTDARGIRRFHGAFTGGFSAGYFNTAGSKEGWAPQTFVSSRSNRAGKSGQQPEDFMDEEDLGAFGIAPRAIRVNKDFAAEGSSRTENTRKRHHEINEGPIPGLPPLRDLIVPVSESMGVQLLKKMGWKPGQGIGPRISIKEKQRKTKPKVSAGVKLYGCPRPEELDEDDGDDLQGILFAPDDIDIHGIKAKENWHGLGYVGLDTNPVLATFSEGYRRELPVVDKSRKLAITGEAFGVGAYEEEDANIYSVDDMTQYDFELGLEPSSSSDKSHKSSHQQRIGYIGKELEGFHLSSKPVPAKKLFPPPTLPKSFQPFHRLSGDKAPLVQKQAGGLDRHKMNARDREALIDEEPPAEGSVFKHLKLEDRIRLQGIRKSIETPTSTTESEPPSQPKDTESFWSKFRASSGSSTFKPFAQDEDKQKRYEVYLQLKETKKEDVFMRCQPSTMTEWEKQREQEEFQRAASIYKPLSQSMASRFVSEKQPEAIQAVTGLATVERVAEKSKGDIKSVKRETFEWHPDRLLCRRFNIPNPYPESNLVGILKVKRDKYSIFNFLELPEQSPAHSEVTALTEAKDSSLKDAEGSQPSPVKGKQKNPPSLFSNLQDDGPAFKTTAKNKEPAKETDESKPEGTRPPMDLFKAIFQDTDSEKDDDSGEDEVQGQPSTPIKGFSLADIIPKSSSTRDRLLLPETDRKVPSNPTGVFSNIDFDSLNSKNKVAVPPPIETKKLSSIAVRCEPATTISSESGYYGPALPPPPPSTSQPLLHSAENGTQKHSPKRNKKKSKHKHKHKKIKKKKHKKSRGSSSDDSDSSDEEIDLDKKLLNRVKKIGKHH